MTQHSLKATRSFVRRALDYQANDPAEQRPRAANCTASHLEPEHTASHPAAPVSAKPIAPCAASAATSSSLNNRIEAPSARQRLAALNGECLRNPSISSGLSSANKYGVLAGLNAALALRIHHAQLARMQSKAHMLRLSGLKMNARETFQLVHWRKRGLRGRKVQLDDLVSRALTGVANIRLNADVFARLHHADESFNSL